MADLSFFHLTRPQDRLPADRILSGLTPEEFDTVHAEAEPLADVLLEAISAYATEHDLSMMAAWMAADIVRYCIGRDIQADEADA